MPRRSIYLALVPLFAALLIWNLIAAPATCVVKLKVSANDNSDDGITAYVKQVLAGQGYKVIDDWLFTLWSASDYDVKIVITHTTVANFGFPATLMGMQLCIADSSGKILVNADIDRSNLEGDLQASIPVCNKPVAAIDAAGRSLEQRVTFSAPADVGGEDKSLLGPEP